MSDNSNWPFDKNNQVTGMRLPDYLAWAAGNSEHQKKLLLPPIQRGFVWKPRQIVELWDSLLRGMPIGSLMLSKLTENSKAKSLNEQGSETVSVGTVAMGLVDGQQRTLAMFLGWPIAQPSLHCIWIDLGEEGQAGSPFELRITTKTQPFGFQHLSHSRLSKHDRKQARIKYDEDYDKKHEHKRDYELFELSDDKHDEQPRPWKAGKDNNSFIRLKKAWGEYIEQKNDKKTFVQNIKNTLQIPDDKTSEDITSRLERLYDAFKRLGEMEVPLILIPEHISQPRQINENLSMEYSVRDPLTLLFERIGSNGTRLSTDDLLFSMIKQQWPEAHDLVENHRKSEVGYLMGSTDYVMTAFRLGAAEFNKTSPTKILDNPRPNPNDFHRHLGSLLGRDGDDHLPLRSYLLPESKLVTAFKSLYKTLSYEDKVDGDIGIPYLMMPHLPRGLIQVLLRWIMLNQDDMKMVSESRHDIIAFALFWYLCVWNEDKASKKAFEILEKGAFHSQVTMLYMALTESPAPDEIGLALPLVSPTRLREILIFDESPSLRSSEKIFSKDDSLDFIGSVQEREFYKRFRRWRKPLLLWFQRAYVYREFEKDDIKVMFKGITDEDAVPYDYDHLCPQNHWGADRRLIQRNSKISPDVLNHFDAGRSDVGNCIGNLHVLESSLNRSCGDEPLEIKLEYLKKENWSPTDSQLYLDPKYEELWKKASPTVNKDSENYKDEYWKWEEGRLKSFQQVVEERAFSLYKCFYDELSFSAWTPERDGICIPSRTL